MPVERMSGDTGAAGARMGRSPGRAVVTGGAGFLGSHLCDRLLADGYEVYCIDNLLTGSLDNIATAAEAARFHFIRADVSETIPDLDDVAAVLHLADRKSVV